MDADLIFSRQLRQIEKEKRDKEIKLKTQEKKVLVLCLFRNGNEYLWFELIGGLF